MSLFPTSRLIPLLSTLRQPQWIAAILSLGFHGVLFAAGPSFSSLNSAALEGNNPDLQERRVPLVELTPEEQGRLPDFSSPAYSPFPDSNSDLFSLFPPSGSSLPLDTPSDFGSSFSTPTPKLPLSTLPSGILPYRFPQRSSLVLPPRTSLPPIANGSAVERPTQPSTEPEGPAATAPSSPTTTENGATPDTVSPNPPTDDNAQANASGSSSGAPTAPGDETPTSQRASDLLARVEYSDAQTSDAEVEFAKAAWEQAVKEKLGDGVAEAPEPITLQVPYSGRLCLSPEPTEGLLGLVGLPDETETGLTLWTSVLKSTGYPFLNQAAEQALQQIVAQQADPEEASLEPNILYQVIVKVEYDSETCLSREALLRSRTANPNETSRQPQQPTP